eukprot:3768890-Amphidinium_carterae.1
MELHETVSHGSALQHNCLQQELAHLLCLIPHTQQESLCGRSRPSPLLIAQFYTRKPHEQRTPLIFVWVRLVPAKDGQGGNVYLTLQSGNTPSPCEVSTSTANKTQKWNGQEVQRMTHLVKYVWAAILECRVQPFHPHNTVRNRGECCNLAEICTMCAIRVFSFLRHDFGDCISFGKL